jgi:hypothetical protein
MFKLVKLAGAICVLSICSGCVKEKPQEYWERQAAQTVIRYLHVYDALNPGVAKTNVGQIITNIDDRPYPVDLHRELLRFSKDAGFTNSFFEKYVFVPTGVTNFWVRGGKPLLINFRPFPNQAGKMQRVIIYESVWQGEPSYATAEMPEWAIQQAFKEAGVEIPEPPRFPPAPPIPPPPPVSFDRKVHAYFRSLAVQLGMSSYHGRVLERIAFGLGALSVVIVCALGLRYLRRRQ